MKAFTIASLLVFLAGCAPHERREERREDRRDYRESAVQQWDRAAGWTPSSVAARV